MGRFDYIKYDAIAQTKHQTMKILFGQLEECGQDLLPEGRAKALFFTRLEEAYMWSGKAIRDEQTAERNSILQEERGE